MAETIYDQWGRSFALPGFYDDYPHGFRLTHYPADGSDPITMDLEDEPVGWASLKLTLKRSSWHGVNHEFSTSDKALQFDRYSGRDFVQSIFLSEGEDARILLDYFLIVSPTVEVIEYQGRLNLATYSRTDRLPSVALERDTLQSQVLARWETVANLTAVESLNNTPLTPPTLLSVPLTSQSVLEKFKSVAKAGQVAEQVFPGDTNTHIWVFFDTSQPTDNEVAEFSAGGGVGLTDSDGPVANDQWLFKLRSGGVRRVQASIQYRITVIPKKKTISVGAAKITGYSLTTVLVHLKANGTRQEYNVTTPITEGVHKRPPAMNFAQTEIAATATGSLDVSLETTPGDKLFLYGLLSFSHNKNELQQTQVHVRYITQSLSITGRTQNSATPTKGLTIGDALSAGLAVITGQVDRLRSDFYSLQSARYAVDGCGARRLITNGFQIRQFKPAERPIETSLQDMLTSLSAIDCIGIGYGHEVVAGEPVAVMRVEPVGYFYRPVELLRLDEVSDYKEDVIKEELFSTLEVGYQEWVTEGAGALEELFTTHQVQTPIRHEQAKKVMTSKLVASSLAIERTRREQFTDTPKDGTPYDDKAFLIACKPIASYTGALLFQPGFNNNILQPAEVIPWLTVGSKITIAGAGGNNGTYTVTFVSDVSKTPWTFYVAESIAPANLTQATIAPVGNVALQPETGGDLVAVMGLDAPDDTYNLRLSPGRMLWANVPVWAGCLVDKSGFATVNKTKMPANNQVVTALPDTDTCGMRGLVGERETIDVDRLLPKLLFRSRQMSFKTRLSFQQMQRLRLGLAGLLPIDNSEPQEPIDRNHGYVSCLDESGVRVGGFVKEVDWSPVDEAAVFTLGQLALDLNDTTSGLSCAQFMGWSLEQAETADARTRRRIELCTFEDVDPL